MTDKLGIKKSDTESDEFRELFSANISSFPDLKPWATPYAVSVFGNALGAPDPFGGFGYGDGRALSIGEFETPSGEYWELQWKGSGMTPFSRQFDGRAVLRSSVREFLTSEAMHNLGVPTTRAVCLTASESEYILRGWYSDNDRIKMAHQPNVPVHERLAITTRAAPSFIRIGHVELFARRMARSYPTGKEELIQLLQHALKREFQDIDKLDIEFEDKLLQMLKEVARRQAVLTTEWLRVGYVQGNYNSDNCLLSGRTMDYGPFGFVERYDPLHNPFTSDPERKYGFERQPLASQMNLITLAQSLIQLLGESRLEATKEIVETYFAEESARLRESMRAKKLGLPETTTDVLETVWKPLAEILKDADFTLFFRELAKLSRSHLLQFTAIDSLQSVFYEELTEEKRALWIKWLRMYASKLDDDDIARTNRMNEANPKYIPREWLLVKAYESAEQGDYSMLKKLQEVFLTPYDEHPDFEATGYRKTPPEYQHKAGVSFYS